MLGKSSSVLKYCVFCGNPSIHDSPSDKCAHEYKLPYQTLIPCRILYHDADWLLYSVRNEIKSVYLTKQDYTAKQTPVGSGGIVLRNPQIIFKSWELKSVDSIIQFLSHEHNLSSELSLDIITVLWHVNDLLIGQSDNWSINDIFFIENCPKLPLIKKTKILEMLDEIGSVPVTQLFNYIYLHGHWEAKVPF
ncbi:MAG: hypothetical protein ACFFD1_08955 [Candidatus Thorarchaeota archaeon]